MRFKLGLFVWLILGISIAACNSQTRQQNSNSQKQKTLTGSDGAGSVWPMPKKILTLEESLKVAIDAFTFETTPDSKSCSIMVSAFERYEKLVRSTVKSYKLKFRPLQDTSLSTLYVNLTLECEAMPSIDMDESYNLTIAADKSQLQANSIWGIIRGLETFSQLVWVDHSGEVMINETRIEDAPRFAHRGILIDTARHYLPVNVLYQVLESMAYNKMNVLHWHIVDDQSFPYYSQTFPELSGKGAYDPATHIYTPEQVLGVIYYARQFGIRVVPEFDSPGHSQSWGKSQPNLLTECYSNGKFNGNYGPINPTNEDNYPFIKKLWTELKQVFPDKYIHLGGDEVNFYCWTTNPEITAWMAKNNITGDYAKLEQYYIQKVINISNEVGFSYIVWQEVIDNGIKAKEDTVVEVWLPPADKELAKVTGMGYKALVAQPWYLDYISYGRDWETYYKYEPLNFTGTAQQKELVLGGEACLWGEYVDSTNLLSRLWPRASAVAERLWSPASVNNTDEATPRLHQHRCRMLTRNIPAEPLWIGHCGTEWQNYS